MKRAHESVTYDARRVNELRKLVSQGEGLTLEFKRKASFPEKIVREMIESVTMIPMKNAAIVMPRG